MFRGRRIADITADDLSEWLEARTAGKSARTKRRIRGYLVAFWAWAQKQGVCGAEPVTAAERLAPVGVVAEEMGTSVAMLHQHYHNPQPEELGERWFMIRFDPLLEAFLPGHDAENAGKPPVLVA